MEYSGTEIVGNGRGVYKFILIDFKIIKYMWNEQLHRVKRGAPAVFPQVLTGNRCCKINNPWFQERYSLDCEMPAIGYLPEGFFVLVASVVSCGMAAGTFGARFFNNFGSKLPKLSNLTGPPTNNRKISGLWSGEGTQVGKVNTEFIWPGLYLVQMSIYAPLNVGLPALQTLELFLLFNK